VSQDVYSLCVHPFPRLPSIQITYLPLLRGASQTFWLFHFLKDGPRTARTASFARPHECTIGREGLGRPKKCPTCKIGRGSRNRLEPSWQKFLLHLLKYKVCNQKDGGPKEGRFLWCCHTFGAIKAEQQGLKKHKKIEKKNENLHFPPHSRLSTALLAGILCVGWKNTHTLHTHKPSLAGALTRSVCGCCDMASLHSSTTPGTKRLASLDTHGHASRVNAMVIVCWTREACFYQCTSESSL